MKKLIMMSLVVALSASMMIGCGATASVDDAEVPAAAEEPKEEVSMENPWEEITEEDATAEDLDGFDIQAIVEQMYEDKNNK